MDSRRTLFGAVLALGPTVFGTMLAATGVQLVVRTVVAPSVLTPSNDAAGTYLQTLGTIYAVLLAFVVFVVWTQFTETRSNLEREANALADLVRSAGGLCAPLPERITLAGRRYADLLLGMEWKALATDDPAPLEAGWSLVDELWDMLRGCEPKSETERVYYAEVLARYNELSDARTARIASARTRIPLPLRVLLYTGAFFTVGSMCLLGVQSAAIHCIMTASMAGAVAHVLVVVEDLDQPFRGYWQVPSEPFERLARQLGRG